MTEKQKKDFGKNVQHLLIDKDIRPIDLAQKAGVSRQFFNAVLKGISPPPFSLVLFLSKELDV